jgi:hypothetical protein
VPQEIYLSTCPWLPRGWTRPCAPPLQRHRGHVPRAVGSHAWTLCGASSRLPGQQRAPCSPPHGTPLSLGARAFRSFCPCHCPSANVTRTRGIRQGWARGVEQRGPGAGLWGRPSRVHGGRDSRQGVLCRGSILDPRRAAGTVGGQTLGPGWGHSCCKGLQKNELCRQKVRKRLTSPRRLRLRFPGAACPRERPSVRGPDPGERGPGERGPGERGPGERGRGGPGERGPGERGRGDRGDPGERGRGDPGEQGCGEGVLNLHEALRAEPVAKTDRRRSPRGPSGKPLWGAEGTAGDTCGGCRLGSL